MIKYIAGVVALTASCSVCAGPTLYPFHPTKVVSSLPGMMQGNPRAWAPVPYSQVAMTQYASRTASGAPVYALRGVNFNAAAIRTASIARMATPAGVALGAAMLLYNLEWSPSGENDWAYPPSDYPDSVSDVNCNVTNSEISSPAIGQATIGSCIDQVVSRVKSHPNLDGPVTLEILSPDLARLNASWTLIGGGIAEMARFSFIASNPQTLADVLNGVEVNNTVGSPSNEEVYTALDQIHKGGTATTNTTTSKSVLPGTPTVTTTTTTNNNTWINFFTDPITGMPISTPSNIQDDADIVNSTYNDFMSANPGAVTVPPTNDQATYQKDTEPTPPSFEEPAVTVTTEPAPAPEPCTGAAVGTLGCIAVGTMPMAESLSSYVVPAEWQPVSITGSASCPADVTVNTSKGSLSFSYQPTCDAAVMLHPLVLLISTLAGIFIVTGRGQQS